MLYCSQKYEWCSALSTSIHRNEAAQARANGAFSRETAVALANMFSRPLTQGVVTAVSLAAITFVGFSLHAPMRLAMCGFTTLIIALSFFGNAVFAVGAALVASICLDYFFTQPLFHVTLTDPVELACLVFYVGVAVTATTLVSRIKRRTTQLQAALVRLEEQIAARKRTEGALQQAQEFARVNRVMLMGEMTASIAHEINQPLTGIVSNAGTSLRYLTASEPDFDAAKRYLELIVRDGRRAADIINRVRGLARRAPPSKLPVDLNDTIVEAATLAQGQLNSHHTRLQFELSGDLPRIPADRVQLQQVVLNLIINSAEAMNDMKECEPKIAITSGLADAERVFVEVRDSGPGLKPEDADRVFNSFYTTKHDGLGMGLSISRLIVEAHGGELRALPNVPSGAVFRLTLPVQDLDV